MWTIHRSLPVYRRDRWINPNIGGVDNAETDTPSAFKNEHRALLNRWLEESDIEDTEMAKIVMSDIEEWLDEDVVEFECDMVLDDDDDDEEEG